MSALVGFWVYGQIFVFDMLFVFIVVTDWFVTLMSNVSLMFLQSSFGGSCGLSHNRPETKRTSSVYLVKIEVIGKQI